MYLFNNNNSASEHSLGIISAKALVITYNYRGLLSVFFSIFFSAFELFVTNRYFSTFFAILYGGFAVDGRRAA